MSLFGAPKTSTPFSWGAPAAAAPAQTPSLFGQPQQQPQQSLFGQPAAPAAPSLFGSQPAPAPGLFGAAPAPTQTPSLFGASQSQQPPSLFGQAPQQQPQSLFGASQPAQSTSLFGQPAQQQQQQQQQPSAFGATQPAAPTPSLFGQSQSAASTSLFGAKPLGASSFGASSLGQSSAAASQPVPKLGDPYPPLDPNEASIESRLEAVKDAWDSTNPKCRFQTYFYNVPAPPNTVAQYRSPQQGADEKAWLKAVRENPDPEKLVPALAIGFPAVQKRIEGQVRQSQAHQSRLTEIHDHLSTLSSTHSLTTSLRALRASQNATALSARLLNLVAKASALSPNRNMSIRKEEEELRINLEGMKGEVDTTLGRGNELWAGVGALKARRMEGDKTEWAVVDEEGLKQVLEILASQQAGLDHLTRTLNAARADVEVMNEAFGLSPAGRRREA